MTSPTPETGLTSEEALSLLSRDGPNEVGGAGGRAFWRLAADVAGEPMFLLLTGCGALYWMLGDRQEAFILLGFVFLILIITLAQDWKTERALSVLRDLSSPRAVVVRDGVQRRIAGRDVVAGDRLIVSEGDRVPADAWLLTASHLAVDESLLTGESVAVVKHPGAPGDAFPRPGNDGGSCVYAGTIVVQGQGVAQVAAIGARTEMGKIGSALKAVPAENTPLQLEARFWVRRMALGALALCVAVAVIYAATRSDAMGGLLAGLTLAMAILPNEFPMVLVIFLSLGAWRLSKKKVLTRRMAAVEMLGAATVLCADKTGTLTQNRMAVEAVAVDGRIVEIDPRGGSSPLRPLAEAAALAGQPDPIDPMEVAIRRWHTTLSGQGTRPLDGWTRVHEYPLSRGLQAMSNLWVSPDGKQAVAAAKGAPEAIFDLCHLPESEQRAWTSLLDRMTGRGLRVLAVAMARPPSHVRPGHQHDFEFDCLGLLGFVDPVRPAAPAAVASARRAGLRVVMITGDHSGTALSVARKVGLDTDHPPLTGSELESLSETELQSRVRTTTVFARVLPEQKLRLVRAFKANGDIVAMTGDGVNDAPALKAAHIGIAMGERGTDVAREAADVVLLDDDFSSLVEGVRLGRRVFDNLKKALAYLLAIHIPIAGMTLIPVALKWPLVLLPIHIAFLHLIIDPAGSVVFEAESEERDVMERPPRSPSARLFGRDVWGPCLFQGSVVLLVVLTLFGVALHRGQPTNDARAITFTALIVANLGLIFTNRSRKRSVLEGMNSDNKALWWVTTGSVVFLAMALCVPVLRSLFHFSVLHPVDVAISVTAGAASVGVLEVIRERGGRGPA